MKKPMRVLLVEDNPGDADLIREMLPSDQDSGFSIHCVGKMADAVACLAGNGVDIALLDLNLPDSRGIETVRCARRAAPDTPIVVLTGYDDEQLGTAAVQSGAQDYLIKGKTPAYHLSRVLRYAVQRQHAEEKIRESERFLRSTLDALSTHIAIIDDSGRILAVNRAWNEFARIDGWHGMRCREDANYFDACQRMPGKNGVEAGHAAAFSNGIHAVLDGAKSSFEMEYSLTGPSGTCWFHGRVAPFPGEGDRRVVIAHEDITARKQAEDEKIRLVAQLRHAYKMEAIGTLAGGIAHDFNNILSSVLGYTELCLMDIDNGTPLENNLQEVYRAGLRAKELVRQILAYARKEEGRIQPIQVSAVANEVATLIRSVIPASIDVRLKVESHAYVMAEPTQIHQILMNLFTNAAQAMESNGGQLRIHISETALDRSFDSMQTTFKPGNYLKITVSDTGTGIPPEKIDKIFDPYFTTKGRGEGTGLGLSVVHGIIKSHEGEITVQSQVGQGSVFTIYLPLATRRIVPQLPVPSQRPRGTERILFVDDEVPIARLNQKRLSLLGYRVTTFNNSLDALECLAASPDDFDLVITDMTMPMMSGDQLALEIRKIKPTMPIILCTGYSKKLSPERAAAIGIDTLLMKPVATDDMIAAIRNVLAPKPVCPPSAP